MILSNPRSQSPAAETSPLSQDIRNLNLQLLDFSSDCVKLIDGSGVVVFLNAGGQRELEVDDCSQIVGEPWLSFWPEPDRTLASEAFAGALAGDPKRFQGRCPTAKGTPKWWDVALTPLPRDEGSGEFVLVVSRDITERKSAEERLQREYRKLELVYELSVAVNRAAGTQEIYEAAIRALISGIGADRAAVLIADADGVMRFKASAGLSPEYCRAVEGHSPWSAGDREARAFTVPDIKQASALAAFAPALEREGIASLAFVPLLAQDGLIGKFMFYYDRPHVFTEDEVRLAETVATHVAFATERQRREHAIRVSEEKFRSLSACFPVGVFTTDSAGHCTYSNANARTVCGFDETSAGKAWTAFISPEDRSRVSGEWNGAVNAERAFSGEMRFTSGAGTVRWADVHLNPILAADGRMAGYVGVVEDITDRKNAETEVRRLNAVLSNRVDELMAILDVAPVGLMIATDSAGSEITTNSYLQRLTGVTPGSRPRAPKSPDPLALLSANGHEVPGEDLPVRKALCTARDVAPAEYMLRGREGRTFHVLAQARPLLTDDAMVRGAVASYVDITARKRAEQALHESEQRLRMALSAGRMGTWEWDLTTGAVAWSAELERMHGRGEGEFPRTFDAVLEEIHPEDRAAVSGRIRNALRQASDFHVEYRYVRPDGVLRWVEGRGKVLTGSDGAPERMAGVCCDITERKHAAEALRRSEQRLQAILDNSTAFIYLKDGDGKILLVNDQFERMFGVSGDRIVGQTDYDLFPGECAEALRANDSMVLRAGRALEFEERIPHKGGTRTYISIKFPVPDPESGAVAVCGISTDITERKRLEEKMRESAKLESLGILAGGIAHDFNNLLTGILGYASLLTMETSASGRVRHLAGEIISGGQRAAQLTNQMLAYAGKGKFIVEAVDVSRQARELADLLRAALPKNVRIVLDLADELPCVEADASQLQQVIMNLVINGAEAISGQHGTVTVRTCLCATESPRSMGPDELPPGPYVGIAVSDTGSGMDASTMARIFDPFFTTKFTGRGLGLAAVQGIVRSHGGGISVTSAPGKGTTFEVWLPVSDRSSEAPAAASEGRIAAPAGEGLVLVVDDEEIVRSTVSVMLSRFGYSILEAADGAEAVRVFEQHADRIHVVLLDMMMPLMSGGEALARLRARNAAVPVIAMSGYTEEEAKRHFGDGVCSFIQKPFTVQRLHAAVEPVLAKGRPASGDAREPGRRD